MLLALFLSLGLEVNCSKIVYRISKCMKGRLQASELFICRMASHVQ